MILFDWITRTFAPFEDELWPGSSLGERALEFARSQIGRGEQGANNVGPDLDKYRTGKDGQRGPGGAWCAAFGCWYLEQAGFSFKRSHSAKTLFANCLRAGAVKVERPAPGDPALWHRGAAGAWTGHWGIVSRVEGSAFWSIEGNKGGGRSKSGAFLPSKVREFKHELGEPLLLGFCRLP